MSIGDTLDIIVYRHVGIENWWIWQWWLMSPALMDTMLLGALCNCASAIMCSVLASEFHMHVYIMDTTSAPSILRTSIRLVYLVMYSTLVLSNCGSYAYKIYPMSVKNDYLPLYVDHLSFSVPSAVLKTSKLIRSFIRTASDVDLTTDQ